MPHYEIIRQVPPRSWPLRVVDTVRSIWLGPYGSKDPQLARLFGGGATYAGVPMSEDTALNYAAVWNAVHLISSDIAKLPLMLYRTLPNGGKDRFRTHPLYRLVHDEPNSEMTSFVFRRTLQAHVLTWGNAYAEIERDTAGRPVALWPLLPNQVETFRDGGVLRYRVYSPVGQPIIFDPLNILHLSGLGADGISGYNLVARARESLGLSVAAERFGATFFSNGATFGGTLEFPVGAALSDQSRKEFKDLLTQHHVGVQNAHRFLALYDGGKYQKIGVDPNAAQFLETRKFQIEEVARWFNLPVHKLKNLDRSTNNNIEHQALEYLTDTLQCHLEMWEQELDRKLVFRLERTQQFFEHVTEGVLRADAAGRAEHFGKLWNVGAISQNEVRARENLNPLPEVLQGDVPFVPAQMMPSDLARQYWQSQIDLAQAKAKEAERPVQPLPPGPDSDNGRTIADLEEQLRMTRQLLQAAEDRVELRAARIVELEAETAERAARVLDAMNDRAAVDLRRQQAETDRDAAVVLMRQAEHDRDAMRQERDTETTRAEATAGALQAAQEASARDSTARHAAEYEVETTRQRLCDLEAVHHQTREALTAADARWTVQRSVALSALRAVWVETFTRLLQRESDRARKAQTTSEKLRSWVERFYPLHAEVCRTAIRPVAGAWCVWTLDDPDIFTDRLVARHLEQSSQILARVADAHDSEAMAAELERTLHRWETERAVTVADALVREGMAGHG